MAAESEDVISCTFHRRMAEARENLSQTPPEESQPPCYYNVGSKPLFYRLAGSGALLFLLMLTAVLSGGRTLLMRQMWMDEVHSWLLVTDGDTVHALQALADGADFNPPAWFLVTRSVLALAGVEAVTEIQLRCLSLAWMLCTTAGLYVLLSRHCDALTCCAAILFTVSQPLLIHQSTEIRFYGFWCAAVVWLWNVIVWAPQKLHSRSLRLVLITVLSALVTTAHYFGILSLLLVSSPVAVRTLRTRPRTRDAMTLTAGTVGTAAGLLVCAVFLVGQKAALTRPTWISPTTLHDSGLFLMAMVPEKQLLWVVPALLIGMIASLQRSPDRSLGKLLIRIPESFRGELGAATVLLAMPLLIVLVAWTVQPALVTRYAIVGTLGTAPLLAGLIRSSTPAIRNVLLGAAILQFAGSVRHCAEVWQQHDTRRDLLVRQLRRCPDEAVILFEDRIQWMPIRQNCPDIADRCLLVDFDESELWKDSALRVVQRDAGRRIAKWYPQFAMTTFRQLKSSSSLFLVPYSGEETGLRTTPAVRPQPAGSGIFQVTRLGHSSALR